MPDDRVASRWREVGGGLRPGRARQ